MACLGSVACVDGVGVAARVVGGSRVAHSEFQTAVDDVLSFLSAVVDRVVFPEGVDEECLHDVLPVTLYGVDGVHEVGVVHHDLRRLLGKLFADGVEDVDEACVGKILDVVHDRCAACLYLLCQIAYVRCLRSSCGEEVEQLLYLGEIFQLYLLYEQNVDLGHHVHGLEKVLFKVAVLKEEGVEAVVQILLEMLRWADLGQDVLHDLFVVVQDVVERYRLEAVARLEVQELSEGEAAQVVAFHDAVELGGLPSGA